MLGKVPILSQILDIRFGAVPYAHRQDPRPQASRVQKSSSHQAPKLRADRGALRPVSGSNRVGRAGAGAVALVGVSGGGALARESGAGVRGVHLKISDTPARMALQ